MIKVDDKIIFTFKRQFQELVEKVKEVKMPAINPAIEQAHLLTFDKNFTSLAQQKDTKLLKTPAIKFMDIKGISNIGRLDKDELIEVTERNPDKKVIEMLVDNRRAVVRRFTRTYRVDSLDKAIKLITDPTSDLFKNLEAAKNRTTDRVIIQAAVGDVVVGKPDSAGVVVTAADDGVITIDATSSFDYMNTVSVAITNFENADIDCSRGTVLALSATEKQSLRNDEHYMNAFFSNQNTVDKGNIVNASGFDVVSFAGSVNGSATVANPILPENGGFRSNVFMAPESIAFAMEVGRLDCERANGKVNSWDITIDAWLKAVRIEGSRIQTAKSTV